MVAGCIWKWSCRLNMYEPHMCYSFDAIQHVVLKYLCNEVSILIQYTFASILKGWKDIFHSTRNMSCSSSHLSCSTCCSKTCGNRRWRNCLTITNYHLLQAHNSYPERTFPSFLDRGGGESRISSITSNHPAIHQLSCDGKLPDS